MADSVLIIDDSVAVREKIIKTLEAQDLFSRYYEAEDGLEGFKKLLASPVDIVLCDLEMPRMDGFKFLGMMQSRPEVADTPVIILTGNNDRDLKLKGLGQGACDYLTKPFDPEELIARMRVHLKIKHLQDDLKRSNELLLELSNTDHLTGLFNRRYLMEALEREVQRAQRNSAMVSLIMMDIDHFKKINDSHGHLQGDVVLQKVAMLLQKELRSYDIAARYGGEEFVAVLPDTSLKEAYNVADRVRLSISGMRFAGSLSNERITSSFGIASMTATKTEDIDDLLRSADDALYRAKEHGRNCIIVNDPDSSNGTI